MSGQHRIDCLYLSQEDLLEAGCLDLNLAMTAAENAMLAFRDDRIMFPDKIVQIFDEDTQERINCLPATLLDEQVCGMKWVSVFPMNPVKHDSQNLSAVIVLSEIEKGFPIAFMDGTLCSNMRVGAMGGIAAKHFARPDAKRIGFIGAGEQAKMHLIAMKTVIPGLEECRVSSLYDHEERQFADEMGALFADMEFTCVGNDGGAAMDGADILVTATSAQAPLLKADWMQPGSFYSHIGGWEDEYEVAQQCDKIVCDDWESVTHRTQTLSRMYAEGLISGADIHADLHELVSGHKAGRESNDERVYFNAVGLSYIDVAIGLSMYHRAIGENAGHALDLQQCMIFEHENIMQYLRL